MTTLKYNYTDIGFCQVHYTTKNKDNQKIYYCLMEEPEDQVRLYRTSADGEADYPVKIKPGTALTIEEPPDEYGKKLYHLYLKGVTDEESNLRSSQEQS